MRHVISPPNRKGNIQRTFLNEPEGQQLSTAAKTLHFNLTSLAVENAELKMRFSSLDPIDPARAQAALETALRAVRPSVPDASIHAERERLAQGVANSAVISEDEDDLALRALPSVSASFAQAL